MAENINISRDHRGHDRLRIGRSSLPGEIYSITIRLQDSDFRLNTPESGNIIFESLEYFNKENRVKMVCCVLMPDHVHVIFQLGEKETLPGIIRSFKRFTAREINKLQDKKGNLWQRQYYDHRIRNEENFDEYNPILYG